MDRGNFLHKFRNSRTSILCTLFGLHNFLLFSNKWFCFEGVYTCPQIETHLNLDYSNPARSNPLSHWFAAWHTSRSHTSSKGVSSWALTSSWVKVRLPPWLVYAMYFSQAALGSV